MTANSEMQKAGMASRPGLLRFGTFWYIWRVCQKSVEGQ